LKETSQRRWEYSVGGGEDLGGGGNGCRGGTKNGEVRTINVRLTHPDQKVIQGLNSKLRKEEGEVKHCMRHRTNGLRGGEGSSHQDSVNPYRLKVKKKNRSGMGHTENWKGRGAKRNTSGRSWHEVFPKNRGDQGLKGNTAVWLKEMVSKLKGGGG